MRAARFASRRRGSPRRDRSPPPHRRWSRRRRPRRRACAAFELRPNEVAHAPSRARPPSPGARCAARRATSSSSRRAARSTEAPCSGRTSPTARGSGKFCRRRHVSPRRRRRPSSRAARRPSAPRPSRRVIAPIRIPATSVNLVLPWFTGKPYALYAHVSGRSRRAGATAWSMPFGFNMRWEATPVPLASKRRLVRWAAGRGRDRVRRLVPGQCRKGHPDAHERRRRARALQRSTSRTAGGRLVRWRVRAGAAGRRRAARTGCPRSRTAHGARRTRRRTRRGSSGKLQLRALRSRTRSARSRSRSRPSADARDRRSTGDHGARRARSTGSSARMPFTDRDCVNAVFRGSVVGGPAFAPRISGPLGCPTNQGELDAALAGVLPSAKTETAKTFMADGRPVTANETFGRRTTPCRSTSRRRSGRRRATSGRSFRSAINVDDDGRRSRTTTAESPQDACESGRDRRASARSSRPAITTARHAVRLRPPPKGPAPRAGRVDVRSSTPTPLVAWRPVVGATAYEIQWSRTTYPWRARADRLLTVADLVRAPARAPGSGTTASAG